MWEAFTWVHIRWIYSTPVRVTCQSLAVAPKTSWGTTDNNYDEEREVEEQDNDVEDEDSNYDDEDSDDDDSVKRIFCS